MKIDIPEMIRGDCINATKEELNSLVVAEDDYDPTIRFRTKCIKEGFKLRKLYPIYWQGWELDEWGAIGTRDGKEYRLETNHNSLVSEII
jgi:hypothetical protein